MVNGFIRIGLFFQLLKKVLLENDDTFMIITGSNNSFFHFCCKSFPKISETDHHVGYLVHGNGKKMCRCTGMKTHRNKTRSFLVLDIHIPAHTRNYKAGWLLQHSSSSNSLP